MIRQLTDFIHFIWSGYIFDGMRVLDATVGNGQDAEFLCKNIGEKGSFDGIDIQSIAIDKTRVRLIEAGLSNFTLICKDHSEINYLYASDTFDMIVYNLGYLPSEAKAITTTVQKTEKSLNSALQLIRVDGVISVTVYPGHEEGRVESDWIQKWSQNLNPKVFHVMKLSYLNQSESSPYLLLIERKK
ncbi:MAG: hypothetical protein BGO41_04195 [Clostridiales bacterium 38-18]|nr:MAG: hypothetical protein BGO41_04195 [Clostridiales bacterium 38-18]